MVKQTTTTGQEINGYLNQPSGPSFQELYESFLKLDKETLATLLAAKELANINNPSYPAYPVVPTVPYPWITWCHAITY